jgi:PPIC-type PPIASE domain
MRKSWLVCVLLGALAWGQAPPPGASPAAQPGNTPPQPPPPRGVQMQQPGAPPPSTAEVPESAPVITIHGVCPPAPKTATAGATGAKTAATAAKKPADCKTVITRAEFEKIAKALQQGPNVMNPQQRRQLAAALPRFMAMSEAAKSKGLDKTEHFNEMVKFAKMQILTQDLQRNLQEEADKITPEQIDEYYKKNPEAYQQFSLDRVFVPRYKQEPADSKEGDKDDEKLTDEQQKAKEAADKAKQEQGEQELDKLAESLRARAASGEDFAKLQKEAFDAAGMKMDSPTINLPKLRRTGLPAAQAAVFDLNAGDISPVISDNSGHYIYKVVSKETLPLDQVKDEIRNTLKTQNLKDLMDKYQTSYHADINDAYFGPAPAPGPRPGGMPMRPQGAPMQPQSQGHPPAQSAPAQPAGPPAPAQQPAATKPN